MHPRKIIIYPQVAASFWGTMLASNFVDFPTGTNDDAFISSSVYSASRRLSAYLLISGPLSFNKLTLFSYVKICVNLYAFLYFSYYLQSKSTLASDLSLMDLLVPYLAVSPWEQGYLGVDYISAHHKPVWVLQFL